MLRNTVVTHDVFHKTYRTREYKGYKYTEEAKCDENRKDPVNEELL